MGTGSWGASLGRHGLTSVLISEGIKRETYQSQRRQGEVKPPHGAWCSMHPAHALLPALSQGTEERGRAAAEQGDESEAEILAENEKGLPTTSQEQ